MLILQKLTERIDTMSETKITRFTKIGDMLEYDRGIAVVLMQSGMHCVGCPASIGETLEEACAVHGMDCESVLAQINDYLKTKQNAQ